MPTETVTLVLDKAQYERSLAQVVSGQDRLARSGERIGQGFVRGERVIRTASANIAGALTMTGDAATTVLVAMQGLERVFAIGIGPTIAVAAGVKAFEILHEQVKKANDAYKDLKDELAKPLNTDPVTAGVDKEIEDITDKVKNLHKEAESPISKTSGIFAALAGIAASTFLPSFLRGPTASALSGLAPPGPASIRGLELSAGKRLGELADDRGRKIMDAADKLHLALLAAVQKFRESSRLLFRDIGSGQFLRDERQRNLENLQTGGGQDMVKEFEDAIARGIPIGPNAQAMVKAARAAAAKGGIGIEDILNADFSNLDVLSKYDFSGLEALSGITINIQ